MSIDRRRFLGRVGAALAALGAAVISVPVVGTIFSPVVRTDPEVWRRVGRLDELAVGETRKVTFLDPRPLPWAGFAAHGAAWLRRESEDEVIALSLYCTHVGCPVRWLESADLFLCPCHGGSFYRDGRVAGGPPPEPLPRLETRIRDGVIEVRTLPLTVPIEDER